MKNNERACALGIEPLIGHSFPVLNNIGFIRVIDYMGNDTSVVQAARVSYGEGTKSKRKDESLINYLMRHNHTSPFEMCTLKIHIKLPIFVARQWLRHRTASVNEVSARYSIVKEEHYSPSKERIRNAFNLGHPYDNESKNIENITGSMDRTARHDFNNYNNLLSVANQSPLLQPHRELARIVLPLSSYTEMYWQANAHNIFHLIALRNAANAQYEIRAYAKALGKIVRLWLPMCYRAFEVYQLNSHNLSEAAMGVIRQLIRGESPTQEESELSEGEWADLQSIIYPL